MRKLPELLTPTKLAELKVSATRKPADDLFLLGDAKQGALVRAITPVLGGNVESFDPGKIDVVRVPAIRGALRWWWRALHPDLSTDELRELERKVWGGVGGAGESDSARASPVRIDVQVTEPGKVGAAGEHQRNDKGGLKALPSWKAAEGLGIIRAGYALFPLQRSEEERNKVGGTGTMPTKEWRVGLEFRLRVRLVQRGGYSLTPEEVQKVRDAIWLWLTFGGYGARTRRGFGALHAEAVNYEEAYKILARAAASRPLVDRPTLAGCVVLEGPPNQRPAFHQVQNVPRGGPPRRNIGAPQPVNQPAAGAGHALDVMLGALHEFRQGTTFGRNPGEKSRPGRSRWPEADSLRALSGGNFHVHQIDESFRRASAPRAQFGLPMNVTFITEDDKKANGSIASTGNGGRWASPLILRPVCVEKGKYVPVVLMLAGHRPDTAWVSVKDASTAQPGGRRGARGAGEQRTTEVSVIYDDTIHGGARTPVREALRQRGSALDAFAQWLIDSKKFRTHGGVR